MFAKTLFTTVALALAVSAAPGRRQVASSAAEPATTVTSSATGIVTATTVTSSASGIVTATTVTSSAVVTATTVTFGSSSAIATATTASVSTGAVTSTSTAGGATSFTVTVPASSSPFPTTTASTSVSSGAVTSTLAPVPATTIASSSPVPGPTGSASCEALLEQCRLTNPSPNYSNFFYDAPCVAAAACNPGKTNGAINRVYPPAARAADQPRLSKTLFDFFSTDKAAWSQQNFIDFYYGTLGKKSPQGPWPSTADEVIAYWNVIAGWTGFCGSKNVPYANLADYFQYASTNAAAGPCGGSGVTSVVVPAPTTFFPSGTVIASSSGVVTASPSGIVTSSVVTASPSGAITSEVFSSGAITSVVFSSGAITSEVFPSSSVVTVEVPSASSVITIAPTATSSVITIAPTATSSVVTVEVPGSSAVTTAAPSSSAA